MTHNIIQLGAVGESANPILVTIATLVDKLTADFIIGFDIIAVFVFIVCVAATTVAADDRSTEAGKKWGIRLLVGLLIINSAAVIGKMFIYYYGFI